jgi:hypothetical protein
MVNTDKPKSAYEKLKNDITELLTAKANGLPEVSFTTMRDQLVKHGLRLLTNSKLYAPNYAKQLLRLFPSD